MLFYDKNHGGDPGTDRLFVQVTPRVVLVHLTPFTKKLPRWPDIFFRRILTVDPSLAFATVMPVKSRASIDSQFLAANGRIVTLMGNLGKDAWVRTVNIDRNSLQLDFTEGAERPAQ